MHFVHRLKELAARLPEVGWEGVFDIAVVTLVIYSFLVALKRTRRSGLIFTGIVIIGAIYLLARRFNLVLTVALLQGFFAVFLVALVIIFQEDLRYFFERVGLWWVERRLPRYKRKSAPLHHREVEILARTLGDLARAKIGALVVIRGKDAIARHLDGGEEVEGRLSESLLKSIFDPHSIGHDGAVILDGHLIDKLGCHLPLSKNLEKLPRSGTRHAAALGLSERSDALCVVVSEERGTISVARRGDIRVVPTPADLLEVLESFYQEVAPQSGTTSWKDFFRKNYREKAVALGLAVALWVVEVQRSQPVTRSFDLQVNFGLVPSGLVVTNVNPATVNVTFYGQRKAFAFLETQDIKLILDLSNASVGRQSYAITPSDLSFPKELYLEDIEPRKVAVSIARKSVEPDNDNGVRRGP